MLLCHLTRHVFYICLFLDGTITGPGTGADGTTSGANNVIPFVTMIILSLFVSHIKAGFSGCN